MKRPWLVLTVALLAACAPVTVRSQPEASTEAVADADLAATIKLGWHDAGVRGRENVRITVDGGHVTLDGRLPSEDAIAQAVAIAREVDGVRSVTARLTSGR